MFGLATYFATNSSKSDIYSESFTARLPRGAERKLVVSRLALGSSRGNFPAPLTPKSCFN